MDDEQVQRKLTAIFLADVAGYSRLMREDEVATFNTLSAYREVMTNLIRQHRGRVVDMSGDGVLAEFSSVVDGMQSAVSIQKELQTRNAELPENRRMNFRIGINIGDVIQEEDRIYGDGVNIAARLEKLAEPGGICISRTAYDQIESKLPLGYVYMGEKVVKNISKPLHAYRVIIDPESQPNKGRRTKFHQPSKEYHHPHQESQGDGFDKQFHEVKSHFREFAKDIKEDEPLGETFAEIKGRFQTFAKDMVDGPERRHQAFHTLIQSKHIKVFLGLACFLFLINALTSFGQWWFQYPLVSIGLATYLHWLKISFFSPQKAQALRHRLLQKELARRDPQSGGIAREKEGVEKKVDARLRFYNHFFVFVGVNTFLIVINLLTSPFHWWFAFPLLGWGIGLFFHWLKLK
jgi:class 3 adenylate cyclase